MVRSFAAFYDIYYVIIEYLFHFVLYYSLPNSTNRFQILSSSEKIASNLFFYFLSAIQKISVST